MVRDVHYSRFLLTNNITTTGRFGICNMPSNNIGNETAAANAAGSIMAQDLFNRKSFLLSSFNPRCVLPDRRFVIVVIRRYNVYAMRIAVKE